MTLPFPVQSLMKARGCTAIVGQRNVLDLSSWLMAQVLMDHPQAQVVCIDGANRFDPLTLARLSRAAGAQPQNWLRQVLVSRVYSGEQLVALLMDRAVPQMERTAPQVCIGLGWLESLYDEDASEVKARQWMNTLVQAVQSLKKSTHLVLFESEFLKVAGPRAGFIHTLLKEVDQVLNWTEEGSLYG